MDPDQDIGSTYEYDGMYRLLSEERIYDDDAFQKAPHGGEHDPPDDIEQIIAGYSYGN